MTRVEAEYACDTFMPPIDPAHWRLWSASPPRMDAGVRTAYLCFTRLGPQPRLPKALASTHEEVQVRRGSGVFGPHEGTQGLGHSGRGPGLASAVP